MGKSIALFFACAVVIILTGSFLSPGKVAAGRPDCNPAYGVNPCEAALSAEAK